MKFATKLLLIITTQIALAAQAVETPTPGCFRLEGQKMTCPGGGAGAFCPFTNPSQECQNRASNHFSCEEFAICGESCHGTRNPVCPPRDQISRCQPLVIECGVVCEGDRLPTCNGWCVKYEARPTQVPVQQTVPGSGESTCMEYVKTCQATILDNSGDCPNTSCGAGCSSTSCVSCQEVTTDQCAVWQGPPSQTTCSMQPGTCYAPVGSRVPMQAGTNPCNCECPSGYVPEGYHSNGALCGQEGTCP